MKDITLKPWQQIVYTSVAIILFALAGGVGYLDGTVQGKINMVQSMNVASDKAYMTGYKQASDNCLGFMIE